MHTVNAFDETAHLNADPLIGSLLEGRYEVKRLLGRGGMGSVYAALQISTSREVAIKMITPGADPDGSFRKRFLREAYLMSQLKSPHTVTVFDFGQTSEGHLFIAMELLDGCSLEEWLQQRKLLSPSRILNLLSQACNSLSESHAKGIIHRDIKPDNLFVLEPNSERPFVQVLDFGIARQMDDHPQTKITKTGFINGTPHYMAPEIALGKTPAPTTDIYALGIIFYQMLTGEPPFSGDSMTEILMAHCNQSIPRLQSNGSEEVTSAFQAVLDDALEKVVARRIQSVDELRARFETLETFDLQDLSFTRQNNGSMEQTVTAPSSAPSETLPSLTSLIKEGPEVQQSGSTSGHGGDGSKQVNRSQTYAQSPKTRPLFGAVAGVIIGVVLVLLFFATPTKQVPADELERATALLKQNHYPLAIELINQGLTKTPNDGISNQVLGEALLKYTQHLVENGQSETALAMLKAQSLRTPLHPVVTEKLPLIDAQHSVRALMKKHGSRSRKIQQNLEETLFKRYPKSPVVYYEAGRLMRPRFIPIVSLGYFDQALKRGKYAGDPLIFETIEDQLSEELPFDESGRAAFARKLAQTHFSKQFDAWAQAAKSSKSLEAALNSHVSHPKLASQRWSQSALDMMILLSEETVERKSIEKFLKLVQDPRAEFAWTRKFLPLMKAHSLWNRYPDDLRAALTAELKKHMK